MRFYNYLKEEITAGATTSDKVATLAIPIGQSRKDMIGYKKKKTKLMRRLQETSSSMNVGYYFNYSSQNGHEEDDAFHFHNFSSHEHFNFDKRDLITLDKKSLVKPGIGTNGAYSPTNSEYEKSLPGGYLLNARPKTK